MSKEDFVLLVSRIHYGPNLGESVLKIQLAHRLRKGACYENSNNLPTLTAYGESWDEVYEKLTKRLVEEGYIGQNKNYDQR